MDGIIWVTLALIGVFIIYSFIKATLYDIGSRLYYTLTFQRCTGDKIDQLEVKLEKKIDQLEFKLDHIEKKIDMLIQVVRA